MILVYLSKFITAIFILRLLFAWSWVHPFNGFFRQLRTVTDWIITPLHRILKTKRQTIETTLVIFLLILLRLWFFGDYHDVSLAYYAPIIFVLELLDVIYLSLLFIVIYSWIAPMTSIGKDMDEAFTAFLEPLMRPIRSMLPNIAGFDFAPLILLFLLSGIKMWIQNRVLF